MAIESINPATGELMASYDEWNDRQIEQAVAGAQQRFKSWARTSFGERGELMHRVAANLRKRKAEYARLITLEMGKPLAEAEAEVEKCAWGCDYYADHAEEFLSIEPVMTNALQSYVAFEPLGIILGIMPWNFPFWQVYRFAAPTIMAGNTVLLKHASNVPQCALAIERSFVESGFPEGVFQTTLVKGSAIEPLIGDPRIRGVSLTGSSDTGARIASLCGRYLKKAVLELGGSDPFIVLADADLPAAAAMAARARFQNTGQSCIAAKRFIVVKDVAGRFEDLFAEEVAKLKVGNPLERDTRIGPLARADLRDDLEQQVEASLKQGAEVVLGGKAVAGPGYFYTPTIITNVGMQMPVFNQETFGPVAAVIRAEDSEQAIELANDTIYGLGGNIWTQNIPEARKLAARVEAGSVFINGMVSSDVRLPFGGVKQSGYGRELSVYGIREFVNIQTVWIGPATGPQIQAPPTE